MHGHELDAEILDGVIIFIRFNYKVVLNDFISFLVDVEFSWII